MASYTIELGDMSGELRAEVYEFADRAAFDRHVAIEGAADPEYVILSEPKRFPALMLVAHGDTAQPCHDVDVIYHLGCRYEPAGETKAR